MQTKEELKNKERYDFQDFVDIMATLRAPGGCPWDAEQTHESIRDNFIEETYEVIEAIDNGNKKLLCEELGDVLMQVVFHARMEEENGGFDINDVIDGVSKKLVHRHPHVFGDVFADTPEKVLENWDKIKSEEKSRETVTSKLRSVPKQLPALMRAEKVGKKAKCFDFPDAEAVFQKLDEERAELYEAFRSGNEDSIFEETGDLLLTVTSLSRKLGVVSERALNAATDKFIDRFETLENEVIAEKKNINDLNMTELDKIWDKNKQKAQKN